MPLYEYENTLTGKLVELSRPMRLRDDCPPHLKRVIGRTSCRVGPGAPDPSHADQAVPRALREIEQTMGPGQLEHQTGFSKKQLRKIWKIK